MCYVEENALVDDQSRLRVSRLDHQLVDDVSTLGKLKLVPSAYLAVGNITWNARSSTRATKDRLVIIASPLSLPRHDRSLLNLQQILPPACKFSQNFMVCSPLSIICVATYYKEKEKREKNPPWRPG